MKKAGDYLFCSLYGFAILCILFIPFTFYLFPYQQSVTETIFGALLCHFSQGSTISSDSGGMYTLIVLLFIISLLVGLFIYRLNETHKKKVIGIIRLFAFYYLAALLFKYGFSKVCKGQFYLPEPNILYTPLGQLNRDILFWSSMGTSPLYNSLTGWLEITAACLLLFRRTRTFGLLVALAVFVQVLFINLGFDISVKLYTCFLIFLTLLLLSPFFRILFSFFFLHQKTELSADAPLFRKPPFLYFSLKLFAVGLLLLEGIFPYLSSGSWNDDTIPRPYLHGAYEVQRAYCNDSLLPTEASPFKRFFVHRNGYIIFQGQDDQMQDFKMEADSIRYELLLTDYSLQTFRLPYKYNKRDSVLLIRYTHDSKNYLLQGKGSNWRKLPALQQDLRWRSDE